jgi:hypothetical protein
MKGIKAFFEGKIIKAGFFLLRIRPLKIKGGGG